MTSKIEKVCRAAIEEYGESNQKQKALEEMGELTSALVKHNFGRCDTRDVITEIADVMITVSQMAIIFGEEDVTAEINAKIDRLAGRIADKRLAKFEKSIEGEAIVVDRVTTLRNITNAIKGEDISYVCERATGINSL